MTPEEQIYAAYPRKVGRRAALTAITRAIDRQTNHIRAALYRERATQEILGLTEAFAAAVARWPKEEQKFVPHPATWYNQERYLDDPGEWNGKSSVPVPTPPDVLDSRRRVSAWLRLSDDNEASALAAYRAEHPACLLSDIQLRVWPVFLDWVIGRGKVKA